MDAEILKELQEIKKLLLVIVSSQEQKIINSGYGINKPDKLTNLAYESNRDMHLTNE